MDGRRFDQLARALSASAGSRREAVMAATGGVAATFLGVLGIEQASAAPNDKKKQDRRNRNNRNSRKKRVKICHCPDNTGQNCKTKQVSAKSARRHLKKHDNDNKGKCKNRCRKTDIECNVNRPGECCFGQCCFDVTSSIGGICPTDGANCCGLTNTGGYCTTTAPVCCGENACCRTGEVCCSSFRLTTGYCCPAGNTCDFNQPNGCLPPAAAATSETRSGAIQGSVAPRRRSGNT